ncbi:PREDICTED: TMV resistance protein N-like [Nelumbo nucifera]|uniref:ADP-ribosyl cyclase/cyclic ADP-ribose hydrolase n=1 Tax=Nelumbo nucifera TaxID=4432 RepID=A0A1U7Z6I8_NELNU|nr:PREDICTED: TMV resistance protein N-like [Nelumbo nucifera]
MMTQGGSSSSCNSRWNYDVFLSFRGEDTRKNFTDHLYTALVQRGINTFRDDEALRRGEEITPDLEKAIEESRIAIAVLSRNYASSRWCLEELVKILECRKTKGQWVIPLFYDVDSSDVREQTGSFAEAFARHETRSDLGEITEKVRRWREALAQVADLSGLDLKQVADGYQSKFIERVVEEVITKLNPRHFDIAVYPVGIDSRVKRMTRLLDVSSDDVRIIGVCGMGGIGKTTITKAFYNLTFDKFKAISFLQNVREVSQKPNGLVSLQEQLLSDILMTKNLNISSVDKGITVIQERLRSKRVLIILDDVNHRNQLNALARSRNWFGGGSRIIITTRDMHLLELLKVDKIYEVDALNDEESLQLFSWHAFADDHSKEDYVDLSKCIASQTQGLPLALVVLGSSLFGKSTSEWKSAFEKLKVIPNGEIMDILKISYDALSDDEEKDMFLDIAFFFIRMDKDYVNKILEGCYGFSPEDVISNLVSKSLVRIDKMNRLEMHDLLRDMGKKIVHDKFPREPEKRSRLWLQKDVYDVLKNYMGTGAIEGLILDNSSRSIREPFKTAAFANMQRLRLLQLNYVDLKGSFEHLSKELRWLCWHGFPLKCIPSSLNLENLAVLDMQHSSLKQVWKKIKPLKSLKIVDLSHSHYLTTTPDFLGLPNLESLILKGCTRLVKVDNSIGHLHKLNTLNLKNCKKLKDLPSNVFQLKSLKNLTLSGCSELDKRLSFWSWGSPPTRSPDAYSSNLVPISGLRLLKTLKLTACTWLESSIPSEIGSLPSLELLDLSCNNFYSLPDSFRCLGKLKHLNLEGCTRLKSLPAELPSSLEKLFAGDCTSLEKISNLGNLSSLQELDLSGSNICDLPRDTSLLSCLITLTLEDCKRLRLPPDLPSNLEDLFAKGCTSLERLPNLSNMQYIWALQFNDCYNLMIQKFYMENIITLFQVSLSHIIYIICKYYLMMVQGSETRHIFLPGSDIPDWFSYWRMGSSVSFQVPAVVDWKIEGLILCVIYAKEMDDHDGSHATLRPFVFFNNKTKGVVYRFIPYACDLPKSSQEHMWLSYKPCNGMLEAGHQVEVTIGRQGGLSTNKCGVHLVYDSNEKGSNFNQVVCMQEKPCDDLTITATGRCQSSLLGGELINKGKSV